MSTITEIDTSQVTIDSSAASLVETRQAFAKGSIDSEVTIAVLAYNSVEKTKRCVESVLAYTNDVNYDLLLIDNASTDGTLEYFKSVEHTKKRIMHFSENKGPSYPFLYISQDMISSYFVILANDIVVTKNWLSNLLTVARSDPRIGVVNPMSSNVSNLQDPGLLFDGYDDMQKKAAQFNVSDPEKWEERLRIITLGTLFRKECLLAAGLPITDVGFAHNFADDDLAFKVRRSGYKVMLAGDTWVHHDDNKADIAPEKAEKISADLDIGRRNFREKYFGIDAWDDVNNFIDEYLSVLRCKDPAAEHSILGIDVRCGTPLLEIRNRLRRSGIYGAGCSAYTTDAKYLIDLQTVCGAENVFFGSTDFICRCFRPGTFDYVVIGNDINTYPDPLRLTEAALALVKKGGQLFVSLYNVYNIFTFMTMTGAGISSYKGRAVNYSPEEFRNCLKEKGYDVRFISGRKFDRSVVTDEMKTYASECLKRLSVRDINESMYRLCSERYYTVIDV